LSIGCVEGLIEQSDSLGWVLFLQISITLDVASHAFICFGIDLLIWIEREE
jgi:hypothetical protein